MPPPSRGAPLFETPITLRPFKAQVVLAVLRSFLIGSAPMVLFRSLVLVCVFLLGTLSWMQFSNGWDHRSFGRGSAVISHRADAHAVRAPRRWKPFAILRNFGHSLFVLNFDRAIHQCLNEFDIGSSSNRLLTLLCCLRI
jgi:hypothetical protein